MANNTQAPHNITQEQAIQWAVSRLDNERELLVEQFAESNDPREIGRLTTDISQLSLRILRIQQHLIDFDDLKHFKACKEAF